MIGTLGTIWQRAAARRPISLAVCAAVVAAGVLAIAVGEIQGWGWTRLIGAGLISASSIAFGALIGWAEPLRPRLASTLASWKNGIILILTAIMVAPLVLTLLLAFGGLTFGAGEGDWGLILLGTLIVVFMLGISVVTIVVAVTLALQRNVRPEDADPSLSNGRKLS